MDYEQAQATLQQVQAEQAMRRHKAVQNLDRVHTVVMPRLRPLVTQGLHEARVANPAHIPGPQDLQEAMWRYNHVYPSDPMTQTDFGYW